MIVSRWVLAGAVAICLAGCSTAPPGYVGRFSLGASDPRSDPLVMGGQRPLVTVPASLGPILALRETPYVNGIAQDILIGGSRATAGENKIELRIAQTSSAGGASGDRLTIPAPAAETIDEDLARLFPGVDMHVSPEVIAGYDRGSFSYASGHLGSTNCIYAWRYAAAAQPLTLFEAASGPGRNTTAVRLRLCRTLGMPALLDIVQQMANATGTSVDPILGGAAAPEVYRRPMDETRPHPARQAHGPGPRHRSAALRQVRPHAFDIPPRDRAGSGDGPRIPLPNDLAAPQAPGSTSRTPAGDLPMPPS